MTYRITLLSNPKSFLLILLIVVFPVGGILSFFVLHPLLSVIILIVGSYLSYSLIKFLRNILVSRITTGEESVTFRVSAEEASELTWDSITHAGVCQQTRNKPTAYIYNETEDKLLTIPSEYSGFDGLISEIKERISVEFEEFHLQRTESIGDYLRAKLGVDISEPSEEEQSSDEAESAEPGSDT